MDIIRDIFTDLRAIGQVETPLQETIHSSENFEDLEYSVRSSIAPEVRTLFISFFNTYYMFINRFEGQSENTGARR
jgi:hypothetical protein